MGQNSPRSVQRTDRTHLVRNGKSGSNNGIRSSQQWTAGPDGAGRFTRTTSIHTHSPDLRSHPRNTTGRQAVGPTAEPDPRPPHQRPKALREGARPRPTKPRTRAGGPGLAGTAMNEKRGGERCPGSPGTADAGARRETEEEGHRRHPDHRAPTPDTGRRTDPGRHRHRQHRGPGAGRQAPNAGRPHTHTKAAGLSRGATRDGRPSAPARRAPGPRSPRPLTPGSGGSWRADPCPRSASVSRGARLAAGGRRGGALGRTRGRTDGPHADGPAAPAPGRGAESPAGEGSRRADGKQPKEATDRKRKWRRAPPSAPHPATLPQGACVVAASAAPPALQRHFRRASKTAGRRREVPTDKHGEAQASDGRAGKRGRRRRGRARVVASPSGARGSPSSRGGGNGRPPPPLSVRARPARRPPRSHAPARAEQTATLAGCAPEGGPRASGPEVRGGGATGDRRGGGAYTHRTQSSSVK